MQTKKPIRILLMGNGSPENGGCEAITKGTIEILKQSLGDNVVITDAFFDYSGKYKRNDELQIWPVRYPRRWTLSWCYLNLLLKFCPSLVGNFLYKSHRKEIEKSDVVLSLGGDNYSLDYGVPVRFIEMGRYVKKHHSAFVIWGASIGPFVSGSKFEKLISNHFNTDIDLIFAREEETVKYLGSIGVNKNVSLFADPAFMMQPEECSNKIGFELPEKYLCINFSDLMAVYVTDGNIEEWLKICAETIDSLAIKSSLPMVFIPHVKSDYEFMQRIYPLLKNKDSVLLANKNLNASEMKWIISKSACNIACRTHSTIASFSTSVPTISLGYSIKSKGLNLQMYGHEDYLVYKKDITAKRIIDVYKTIMNHDEEIRHSLKERNIVIKQEALKAGHCLKEYIQTK